jgi:hypothetical protein
MIIKKKKKIIESRVVLAARNAVKRKATNRATVGNRAQNDGEIMIFRRESRQQLPKVLLTRERPSPFILATSTKHFSEQIAVG